MTNTSLSLIQIRKLIQRQNLFDQLVLVALLMAAFSSIVVTGGILWILISESVSFFSQVPITDFLNLNDPKWTPLFDDKNFAIITLISSTLVTTGVSVAIGIPMGTIIAIYLSEFASSQVRELVKPILELLAGVPSVVFGYFALQTVTPFMQQVILGVQIFFAPGRDEFDYYQLPGFNMLSAGIVMGISIIPLISSISEDAMRAVPKQMREGSFAVGATRLQTSFNVVLPAAISGIIASYILGISRSLGQTMIVAVAAGTQPVYTWNPLEGASTISTFIVEVAKGDIEHGSLEYNTIFVAGLALVVMTLAMNLLGHYLSKRVREVY
ncbi:MAG: phosphate ABC transporter permease subunit PstC [Oscillatoriales cyanobacterium SM2_2_1]|nr:phosphate ABC transporter permease subunit PstC [Oscillatoriales cyanobacterium SM2_2_1]